MTEARRCGGCGSELSAEASPQGLCARCLLEAGLRTSQVISDSRLDISPDAAPLADLGPIDPAVLSRLFPQLEIKKLLGRGGMGAVYLARQKALDRLVALKLLAPKPGLDAEFAERFGREARALARLSHPNIVAVYDFGQTEGLFYFLMEYVDGTSLRDIMRHGKLEPRQALALVPQICDALQYAHDEGVVHRDIKPENILIDRKGRIKIADFGLAKLLGAAAEEEGLTGSHHVMGTRNYMAPEQLEKPKQVDHRADIYSLGVVFYEMLTGELPLGRFAPPSQRVHVDVRLDEVVLRALEKEPERRYQRASEVKSDVGQIASAGRTEVPAAPLGPEKRTWPERDPHPTVVTPLHALIALLVGALLLVIICTSNTASLISNGPPFLFFMGVGAIDVLLSRWFRLRLPSLTSVQGWESKRASLAYAALCLLVSLSSYVKTSSFLWIVLVPLLLLGCVVFLGLRALTANDPEKRAFGLAGCQTAAALLLIYPAFKTMNSFSWVYRLSGSQPEPGDIWVLRVVFALALIAVLIWKVQTWRAWSRQVARA